MKCSGCGVPIEPNTKFLCIYKTRGGFELEVGCAHHMPNPGFEKVFGGSNCFHRWLQEFEQSLKVCNHEGAVQ